MWEQGYDTQTMSDRAGSRQDRKQTRQKFSQIIWLTGLIVAGYEVAVSIIIPKNCTENDKCLPNPK